MKKILLYKDPKELSMETCHRNGERRASLKFGMEIAAKHRITISKAESIEFENEDKSRAIVTSIEPGKFYYPTMWGIILFSKFNSKYFFFSTKMASSINLMCQSTKATK